MNEHGGSGGVQVIARVGQVFRALSREQDLSLAQLADRVELPRSTVHRIVTALVAEGFLVSASPAGRVRIGPEFARLASATRTDVWKEAEPYMRRIWDDLSETVECSILEGDHVRLIYTIPARHHLRVSADVGTIFPLHCSSKGRAILAAYEPDVAARMLPAALEAYTDKTLTSMDDLLAELAKVRAAGIAYDFEEATLGICAVSIAIRASSGGLLAISVAVPTQRYWDLAERITSALLGVRAESRAAAAN